MSEEAFGTPRLRGCVCEDYGRPLGGCCGRALGKVRRGFGDSGCGEQFLGGSAFIKWHHSAKACIFVIFKCLF